MMPSDVAKKSTRTPTLEIEYLEWNPSGARTMVLVPGGRLAHAVEHRLLAHAREIVAFDLHTGLGPWGVGEALCVASEDEHQRAVALFGDQIK